MKHFYKRPFQVDTSEETIQNEIEILKFIERDNGYEFVSTKITREDDEILVEVEFEYTGVEPEEQYENTILCRDCQGNCCKHVACYYSPEDFQEISAESLYELLNEGKTSLKLLFDDERDKGVFVVSVRNKDAKIVDMPPYGRGGCILLTDDGCPLAFEKRPASAKRLLPHAYLDENNAVKLDCVQHYSLKNVMKDWLPYQDLLMYLAAIFYEDS